LQSGSSIFPYTTLFRSDGIDRHWLDGRHKRAIAVGLSKNDLAFVSNQHDRTRKLFVLDVLIDELIDLIELGSVHADRLRRRHRQDRNTTPLNSTPCPTS